MHTYEVGFPSLSNSIAKDTDMQKLHLFFCKSVHDFQDNRFYLPIIFIYNINCYTGVNLLISVVVCVQLKSIILPIAFYLQQKYGYNLSQHIETYRKKYVSLYNVSCRDYQPIVDYERNIFKEYIHDIIIHFFVDFLYNLETSYHLLITSLAID